MGTDSVRILNRFGIFRAKADPKLERATEQAAKVEDIAQRVNRLRDTQTVVTLRVHQGRTREGSS